MVSAHNYIHNFDFVSRIWSRLHDKDCQYILSFSKNSLSPFWLTESTLSLILPIVTYRNNTHSYILTSRDKALSFSLLYFDFQQSTPWKCIHSANFFFLVLPFQLDFFQPRIQPQKFWQTPKETKNQYGRRH